jgi:hypothetical protein
LLELLQAQQAREAARLWRPLPDPAPDRPHPQRLAVESRADELGVSLFGAQQAAGEVERRVVAAMK